MMGGKRKSTFLSACKERPLSVIVYLAFLFIAAAFFPRVFIGMMIGFLFADYQQFTHNGESLWLYCDQKYFQKRLP